MRIAIYGCGAMGTVLGAFLTKNGCPVDMVDNYKAHVDAMNEKGAHIVGFVDETIPVKAMLPEQMEGIYDLIILFTKQTANDVVLPHLAQHIDENSTVITLQNGVPEPYVAAVVGEDKTCGGTVLWGATFWEPGVSELTQDITKSDHLFEIGQIDGKIGPHILKAQKVLETMGGKAKVTTELMPTRWSKLVLNACMSGMSAALGCTFGDVLNDDKARACLSYIGHEVKLCCEAEGYTMPELMTQDPANLVLSDKASFERSQQLFLNIYDGLRTAKASMLQDLEKGRKCEVAMIDGYVCDTGDKHGIDTPFADKVRDIVSGIEAGKLPLSFENIALFEDSMFYIK